MEAIRGERRWFVGDAEFDEKNEELTVRGEPVEPRLEKKPAGVLLYLLQHAGDIVTQDELLSAVWAGRYVVENAVNQTISRIRKAIGDVDKALIVTVHGFGYRLAAPVRCEIISRPQPLSTIEEPPKEGDHPPLRPLWTLVERLGIGSNGEAWLGRHDKTREQRVFKFANNELALGALKREITLFRLLSRDLGERAPIVRLIDWNLEHAPYFVEAEYLPGGSLMQWAERIGGLDKLSLADRLETIARIADAVAAIHTVGVLHKDLKPSNILVEHAERGPATIRVGDLGSGSLLDPERLHQINMTILGMTQAAAAQTTGGTLIYLAPEVLDGKPSTMLADVYALGVMLYQIVVGDFHRPLKQGWERDVPDELLREDIALAAEGDSSRRLADAGELARRLRAIDSRNSHRAAEREAARKAELALRAVDRAKARRVGLVVAGTALLAGSMVSTSLWLDARKARNTAQAETVRAKAVKDFLSEDVFAPISSGDRPVKSMSITEMLAKAGGGVDARFAGEPLIAAEVHLIVGRSLNGFWDSENARKHFLRALDLIERAEFAEPTIAVISASELVIVDNALGKLMESLPRYIHVLAVGQERLGMLHPQVLELRMQLARGRHYLGDWVQAAHDLEILLAELSGSGASATGFEWRSRLLLGRVLIDLGRYSEAATQIQVAVEGLGVAMGADHLDVSMARSFLGRTLIALGRFPEARAELAAAQEIADKWAPPDAWVAQAPRHYRALLLMEENQPQEAVRILEPIVDGAGRNVDAELDHSGPIRLTLGDAYAQEGRWNDAITVLEKAVRVSTRASGAEHPLTLGVRLSLAETLIAAGRIAEARQAVADVSDSRWAELPSMNPLIAQKHRIEGLLALAEGRMIDARRLLQRTVQIYESVYGSRNRLLLRAQTELLRVPA